MAPFKIECNKASNVLSWQWSGGTGVDPQPYFRIFNPNTGWDGTYNNIPCQDGVYTWKMRFKVPKTDEINIGVILPLTGELSDQGQSSKNAIILASEKINSYGGINGIPLNFIFEDSQCTPDNAISAFNKLVEMYEPKKNVRARIDLVLLPKLEAETISKGEIFRDIADMDAICHLVRAFEDDSVYHAKGSVDARRDFEMVNSELILHDQIFVEKRIERLEAMVKKIKDEDQQKELVLMNKLKDILENQISQEPYSGKKLIGELKGFYSTRLTFQDRIVYSIDEEHLIVYIHRTKTHYGH